MKKIFSFVALFIFTALLCGCIKNYKAIDDYYTAMKEVANTNNSYTLDMSLTFDEQKTNSQVFSKGDKWKNIAKMEMPGMPITKVYTMFDGTKTYSYFDGANFIQEVPKNKITNPAMQNNANGSPMTALKEWHEALKEMIKANGQTIDEKSIIVPKQYTVKNGFNCRLISYGNDIEACVSDEYGIAVYEKFTISKKLTNMEDVAITVNVLSIDTNEIADSEFELPKGMKVLSEKEVLKNAQRLRKMLMKNYK